MKQQRMGAADNSSMLHFQKLDVYQRSIEFLALAHRVRQQLPRGQADLADQLRRSAQSVPQNIAEGCGRTTRADKAKHYAIARGSAMECASHLDVMRIDEVIDAEFYARGVELLERIVAMLTKLIDP
jgi:four helix bundle protein